MPYNREVSTRLLTDSGCANESPGEDAGNKEDWNRGTKRVPRQRGERLAGSLACLGGPGDPRRAQGDNIAETVLCSSGGGEPVLASRASTPDKASDSWKTLWVLPPLGHRLLYKLRPPPPCLLLLPPTDYLLGDDHLQSLLCFTRCPTRPAAARAVCVFRADSPIVCLTYSPTLLCVQFRHHVEKVKPVDRDDGSNGWAVTVQDLETNTTTTSFCDSILVCNGHYSVPMMPPIKDIDKFRGQQMHSHDYREPEPFRGLRVAVLGASASGLDISLEVASVAKEVLLSHNHPVQIPSELPPNIRQVRGIVAAYEDGFVFGDGSQADADVLLCCTGYEFTFPFLSEECGVTVENNIVKPLYKHLIHTAFPTMAFVGIPFQIVPFPLFDVQVKFFLAVLTGDVTPLTHEEMDADTVHALQRLRCSGGQDRHYHRMGVEGSVRYMEELSTSAHLSPVPSYMLWFYKLVFMRMLFSLLTIKQHRYVVEAGGRVREWHNGREVNTVWNLRRLVVVQLMRLMWRDFGVFSFATKTLRKYLGL
ncbi:flavin-containing monooxygenase FMO GS-OX-like 2 [Portunus trituberculatus]|uniref:flavin-containing monooxygenase FMO GS-OX-like 2 n=1 Tax=Portunus trituberculatus TaxID=210409 RepID=UPI001E1CDBE1|nr:flavin-containing monooxygenase FMO GS-OX-like 2 [Portunus trituberculatus]